MMVKASFPAEKGNETIRNGKLAEVVQHIMAEMKPEAAYFLAEDGMRTGIFIMDLADSTDIPRVAEPLFFGLNADVTFTPVMNADELQAGIAKAGPAIAKFG
jgi:hypothetical protein